MCRLTDSATGKNSFLSSSVQLIDSVWISGMVFGMVFLFTTAYWSLALINGDW